MTRLESADTTTMQILKVAASHFAEKGLAGARVDEIARDAGVNKATIYYHIGGKAELYSEVFRANMHQSAEKLLSNVASKTSAEDKLRAYITTMVENLHDNPCAAPMMMREMASGGENIPEEGLNYVMRIFMTLTEILKQGQEEGEFRESNPAITHLMIIGSIMFYAAGEPMRQKLMTLFDGELPQQVFTDDGRLAAEISDLLVHALKN
ncbi:MAG: TetR/AcrR family transcriptional regulator [Gammaproteobacteria bacterium]|nr:TetR/AcrR family transcriptional regulator [Gammaproteobacteria bacterium]